MRSGTLKRRSGQNVQRTATYRQRRQHALCEGRLGWAEQGDRLGSQQGESLTVDFALSAGYAERVYAVQVRTTHVMSMSSSSRPIAAPAAPSAAGATGGCLSKPNGITNVPLCCHSCAGAQCPRSESGRAASLSCQCYQDAVKSIHSHLRIDNSHRDSAPQDQCGTPHTARQSAAAIACPEGSPSPAGHQSRRAQAAAAAVKPHDLPLRTAVAGALGAAAAAEG